MTPEIIGGIDVSKFPNRPPKQSDELIETMKGRIVSLLVPGSFLLLSKLGDWYRENPYHKYNEWDILILKANNIFGYGVRPVAVVNWYEVRKEGSRKDGLYSVSMHSDISTEFNQWMKTNTISQGTEREETTERHFKWNLENQFVRVPVDTVEEALALYKTREV